MIIPQGSVVDGWAFVGANNRLGNINRLGPVSGVNWSISIYGSWIYEEDAYELFERPERIWCWRSNCEIEIYPVLSLSPTQDQYRTKPEGRKEIQNG